MTPRNLRTLLLLLLFAVPGFLKAQPAFPDYGQLYTRDVVPRIDILIHPDTLDWIYNHVESDHEFRAVFVFNNGSVHDTIPDIGFRLRGNTSRYSQKKSFKVSFNTFVQGQKYYGVEKLNLNGEHNDPSITRARLCWDILREAKVAGARSNHVQVYINGNYYGLYISVEHIDEEFVKQYFGNNDGNLYKCLWPADLTYRGVNPDLYKFTSGDRRTYELKINEETDDYSDIAHFIDVLNNTPTASLPCELEKVFNVQDYLKIAAFDVLTANWDGYIFNKNNFYLYHNTATGLFEYIPYDVDNTYGIDWFGIDWAARNIYTWAHPSEPRPLFTRLLEVPEYKAQYTYYLRQVVEKITSNPGFLQNMFSIRDQISPYVANDPYYPRDYGYNITSFNTSFESGTGAHVPIGLQPFIQTRNSTAISQAMSTNAAPMIKYMAHNHAKAYQPIVVQAFVEDESLSSVKLEYKFDDGNWLSADMTDNGQQGDFAAGDKIYTVTLEGKPANTVINYRIVASDSQQAISSKPCNSAEYTIPALNPMKLYINEFMASNSSTIMDEHGEYDDWIEIYNGSNQEIWLGDKYLSDNLNNPQKYAFPNITLDAGEYLLIWADGQPGQGPLHTSYKLDKDAEEIGLFDNAASGYALIDAITYTNQTNNISMGRVTDGAAEWKLFSSPTPGSSNSLVSIPEYAEIQKLLIQNPVLNGELRLNKVSDFAIYDLTGRKLIEVNASDKLNINHLKSGIYILRTSSGDGLRFLKQ